MKLSEFLRDLHAAGVQLDFEHLRDAFWLARQGRALDLGEPAPLTSSEPGEPPSSNGACPPQPGPQPQRPEPVHDPEPKGKDVFSGAPKPGLGLRPARRVSAPAPHVIGDRLAMTRSMRPFRRPWRSSATRELDEETTAERSAEAAGRVWPVFRAGRERWFEVELVLEDDPAIALWDDVADGFLHILRDSGAFRDVRKWALCDARSAEPRLKSPAGHSVAARSLGDGSVRRLILFITHGASHNWTSGAYAAVLGAWRARAGVAILQAMPRHQWDRTPLGKPNGICAAIAPGDPTGLFWSEQDWWEAPLDGEPIGAAYPLLPFSATAIAEWAAMQMGRGRRLDAVFLAPPGPEAGPIPGAHKASQADTEFVLSLLKSESQQAFDLAVYLSPDPFSISFARRVQEAMFGRQADPSCLAELLFSGLVERAPVIVTKSHYQFTEAAKAIVGESVEASRRALIVADVFQQASRNLETFNNRIVRVEDLLVADEHGSELLPNWVLAVARMTREADEPEDEQPLQVAFFGNPPQSTAAAIASVLARAAGVRVLTSADYGTDRIAAALLARSGVGDGAVSTEHLWQERLDAVVWLGDAPPRQALIDDARRHDVPLVPLAGTGMYAIQVLYGQEDEPDQRDAELGLLTGRLTGIFKQLAPARGGAGPFREVARCILALLSAPGAEGGSRQEHPRIPIYRAGLLAVAGTAIGAPAAMDHPQARLAELAADNAAWLTDNLVALDGISDAWPAGRHVQSLIIWALLQAQQEKALCATLDLLRRLAAAHAETPLLRFVTRLPADLSLDRNWLPEQIMEWLAVPPPHGADDSAAQAARDFLHGQTVPAWMRAFRRLEALGEEGRLDDPSIVRLVQSSGRFDRVQGYVYARYRPLSAHWPLWADMLRFEADELATSDKPDTRVIWLLFLAIKGHLSTPLPQDLSRIRIQDGLITARGSLAGPPDIDEGGECKTLLAELMLAVGELAPA